MFIFKSKKIKLVLSACLAIGIAGESFSQNSINRSQLAGQQNVITTAVPFLTITPDSRRAAMGDAGVASSADANSVFWNAASLAFVGYSSVKGRDVIDESKNVGVSISYAPWLRALVPGISYNYVSGYGRINKRSVIGGSFRFFTFGSINFTDDLGNPLGEFNPSEYAVDVCYATQLSKRWSIGTSLRYINSNLAGTRPLNGITPKVGRSGAGDISAMYRGNAKFKSQKEVKLLSYTVGINLQNLGSRITYSDKTNREYLPANLKIGTAWTYEIDEFNVVTAMLDFNKLMVPTPGVNVLKNYQGKDSTDIDGNIIFERTKSDDPVITAALNSFTDAPGGLAEELKEWNYSVGFEYIYDKQFFVRAGYFNESATKGNRKYLTLGIGIRYKSFGLDLAYLVPFVQRHPLQNQVRFTLLFGFDAFKENSGE
jgi:hypothetical protein